MFLKIAAASFAHQYVVTESLSSTVNLHCRAREQSCFQEAAYLTDCFSCCLNVFPHMPVTWTSLCTSSSAQSSRTCCSFIAESMCTSDCTHSIVSRCVLSPLYLSLFPFAFISHRPPPRFELSSTSSSLFHILCVISSGRNIPFYTSATFMTSTKIVLFVWISKKNHSWSKNCRQLWAFVVLICLRWDDTHWWRPLPLL